MDTKNKKNNDIIRIIIKKKIGIVLNKKEEKIYSNFDKEEIKIIIELILSKSFEEDLNKLMDDILTEKDDNLKNNIIETFNDENILLKKITK